MIVTYNGHKNWNYWNVSLWIGNDESLYRLALRCRGRTKNASGAADLFLEEVGAKKTPDGAPYTFAAVRAAIAGLE